MLKLTQYMVSALSVRVERFQVYMDTILVSVDFCEVQCVIIQQVQHLKHIDLSMYMYNIL